MLSIFKKVSLALCLIGIGYQAYASQGTLYEPHGDELQTRLSDHKMIASDINCNGQILTVASYNSWARGTLNGFMHLPGYEGGEK